MKDSLNNLKNRPHRYGKAEILLYIVGIAIFTATLLALQQLSLAVHWIILPAVLAWGIFYLIFNIFRPLKTSRVNLTSSKISRELRILQISDFHSGSLARAKQAVKIAEDSRIDAVCLTGDIWEKYDDRPARHRGADYLARNLAKKLPTYIISGNHDDTIVKPGFLSRILPIENERGFEFSPRADGDKIGEAQLFGVSMQADGQQDFSSKHKRLDIALAHFPKTASTLLRKNPSLDLALAGDTHGGQVRLPFLGAVFCYGLTFFPELKPEYRYLVRGLADPRRKIKLSLRKTHSLDNRQLLHTCSGAGFSGMPLRTFCPAQVTLISIKPAKMESE